MSFRSRCCDPGPRSELWYAKPNKRKARPILSTKWLSRIKEANETEYWLMLLRRTDYLETAAFDSIHQDIVELLKLLTSIINSTKQSMNA